MRLAIKALLVVPGLLLLQLLKLLGLFAILHICAYVQVTVYVCINRVCISFCRSSFNTLYSLIFLLICFIFLVLTGAVRVLGFN